MFIYHQLLYWWVPPVSASAQGATMRHTPSASFARVRSLSNSAIVTCRFRGRPPRNHRATNGGFLSHGGSPSHHRFTNMIIHDLDDLPWIFTDFYLVQTCRNGDFTIKLEGKNHKTRQKLKPMRCFSSNIIPALMPTNHRTMWNALKFITTSTHFIPQLWIVWMFQSFQPPSVPQPPAPCWRTGRALSCHAVKIEPQGHNRCGLEPSQFQHGMHRFQRNHLQKNLKKTRWIQLKLLPPFQANHLIKIWLKKWFP